jgi:excisionase family DNA binding protein
MSSKAFNPEELASLSGLTVPTIMRWIRKKKLRAHKVRGYAIDPADARAFLIKQAATKRKTVD